MHYKVVGQSEMHVDHFNPKFKRSSPYSNLFPAYGLCNEAKGDSWPSAEARAQGVRFLNPCEEQDYGAQIFEDPVTHELVGTTPAARYHIDMCDLNNAALVLHRNERAELLKIKQAPVLAKRVGVSADEGAAAVVASVLKILEYKIPEIPPPPKAGSIPSE